jgi:PAS domain S-box-containing protein
MRREVRAGARLIEIEMMRLKFAENREKYKITFMLVLVASACLLTYYFHVVLKTAEVFTHFFYIPIILASLWWKRKGFVVALFLAAFLIFSNLFFRAEEVTVNDYLRAGMFILISFIVGQLQEHISRAEQKSKKDFDERKKAEQALRESEKQYRTIFETTGTATMIVEEDGVISMVSSEFEKIFGYAKGEIEGTKDWEKFIMEDDLGRMGEYHALRRNDPDAAPRNYEVWGVDKTGNRKDLLLTNSIIPGTKKSVVSILDITDRKRAEEESALLATVIEQAAEGITITDKNGTIQYVNPALERISGYTREEMIGKNHRILKSSTHNGGLPEDMRDTLERGEVWTGHMINEKKDGGATYKIEVSISPIRDKTGAIMHYVAIERDVTHEAELETQLRQVQKMEAIGTLAGGIAHDFNNILAAIMGYTEMALYDVPEGNSGRRNLEQVLKAGYRGKDLVKQIITFSRRSEQERRPMRVSPIVKEALKLLRASLPTTIEIRQNIEAQSGMVLADPTQIHQVLMNLCSNAAYAMRQEGGVLEVNLANVIFDSVDAAPYPDLNPGPYLKLTVSDTGHGMDRAIMERIFEPFFTTKKPGEGTGMGLAVVHGIVKSCGGAIVVESDPRKRTTFEVFFPRIEGDSLKEADSDASIPTGNERILFVDDEEDLVDMVQQMLERLGYSVIAKTSSIEALKIFQAQPDQFDLVITDQTMPHMTGADLAKELMRIRSDIPIVLCTGFSEVINAEEAKTLGIREFVMKPFATREIAEITRHVLDEIR